MQYSLVGDLILALREQAADVPQSLSAPTNPTLACSPTGSQSFWVKVTQLTPWGESPASSEVTISNGTVTGQLTVTGNCSYMATGLKIYFTILGAGLEDRYYPYTIQSGGIGAFSVQFTLSSTGITTSIPPQRSSAWLPDTDGTALSAASIYRWMNEGLDAATAITEGIRDVTGIPSTAGQAQYQPIGNWRKMNNGFYDGWPITFGRKTDVFRHSNVTGISGTMVLNQDSVVQQVELWPQSSRTSGNGALSSNVGITDNLINYTPGGSGWDLGFGLALIGTYPSDPSQCELIYYSSLSSSQIAQVTRGMGGTAAQAWPEGTAVTECNIYLSGIRYPLHYTLGQSANKLLLPPAWIDALSDYLTARFKKAEQDLQGYNDLQKSFEQKCQSIKGNREITGPRQVQIGGQSGVETVVGAGGYFGGVILP